MSRKQFRQPKSLQEKYPPSAPCTCDVCLSCCQRPGWWSVQQAAAAIDAGYGDRMMLEIAPEFTFGVLSPAFKGCEHYFAVSEYARNGCTFLRQKRCELFGTGHQPSECQFCHHERPGLGTRCHADLEKDWNTPAGKTLVNKWFHKTGLGSPHALINRRK